MYFIHDLYTDVWGAFETKEDLALWWKSKMGCHFDELNVTGKDCRVSYRLTEGAKDEDGILTPVFYWRQYQVFDEDGRSIDIRSWPASVWKAQHKSRYSHPVYYGTHKRAHRKSGPSMYRSTIRQNTGTVDYEELLEAHLPTPEISKVSLRGKTLMRKGDVGHYIENSYHKHCACSKSWKDQCKSRKQWGKHVHIPHNFRLLPENKEDLESYLETELVSVVYCPAVNTITEKSCMELECRT